jgi:putative spermidine/putrescine transport system permease protein
LGLQVPADPSWQIIDTDLDMRAASASGVLIVFTLVVMLIVERLAGLSRQLR